MANNDGSVNNKHLLPLTHPQLRVWYTEKLYPGVSLHNLSGVCRINGSLQPGLVEEAVNLFVKKHEGIRIRIVERDHAAYQYVEEFKPEKLDVIDFTNSASDAENWFASEARIPFSLENGKLFYFAYIRLPDDKSAIFAKFHHILSDGWSFKLGSEEVLGIYASLSRGEFPGEETVPSYMEYVVSEKKYLESERFIKDRDYWRRKFDGIPEGSANAGSGSIEGFRLPYEIDVALSQKLRQFAEKSRISLNVLFVAAVLIYLHLTGQSDDISIGTPVLNRSSRRERSMFGMFTSTMPFRYFFSGEKTVRRFLEEVLSGLTEDYFHQKYPYDCLVRDLELKKLGFDSLFTVCVNYYNTRLVTETEGLQARYDEIYNGCQLYPLELIIKDWSDGGGISVDFGFHADTYGKRDIENMYGAIITLFRQFLSEPEAPVDGLDLLTPDEYERQISAYNRTASDYPSSRSITRLFEEQARKTPDNAAILFKNRSLSYEQLNERSNSLAHLLRSRGIGSNKTVGLLAEHSIETVVAILGILKACGAYVPIDPGYPPERIDYMLTNSGARVLLTNCLTVTDNLEFGGEILSLEDKDLFTGDGSNPVENGSPGDLAYIIYTSGSTGKPKGVMVEQKGLVNYIVWAKKMYAGTAGDSFALYSSLSFDLTVTSVFTPLVSGSVINIYRDDEDEYVLHRIMRDNRVRVVKLTPSHLTLLKDRDNRASSVKRFIVGGEDLKTGLAASIYKSFGGDISIYNEYGPTETVVGCMIHEYSPADDARASVPIGVPADNVQIYILDGRHKPLPPGIPGEMYISGDGVARGYAGNPELTAERFIENPFIKGSRMYKTGDLARFLESGRMEYADRMDDQLKINGFRVEPREIERQIILSGLAADAVALGKGSDGGGKVLYAFVVPVRDDCAEELRGFLEKVLPRYMVPAEFIFMKSIPLTSNGKADKRRLLECLPAAERLIKSVNAGDPGAAMSNKEKALLDAMSKILGKPGISLDDNFYYCGGDSIKAIQITGKLRDAGYSLSARELLAHPVFADMALLISENTVRAEEKPCSGSFKPLPAMLWFLSSGHKNINHYNQSVLLEFYPEIGAEALSMIMTRLVNHHDALRLNYDASRNELFYIKPLPERERLVEYYDLSPFSSHEQQLEIVKTGNLVKSGMSIEKGIPIRACLFNLGKGRRQLLLTAHHMVIDGYSWRVFLDDLATLCSSPAGKAVLPGRTVPVAAWSEKIRNYAGGKATEQLDYWSGITGRIFEMPVKNREHEETVSDCSTLTGSLTPMETSDLMNKACKAFVAGPEDLMLSALARALCDMTAQDDAIIELEGHGREELFAGIDISRTVGWFTSLYPVVLPGGGADPASHVRAVKKTLRAVPDRGMGYGALAYCGGMLKPGGRKPIRFNFLGDLDAMSRKDVFKVLDIESGNDSDAGNLMTALIEINAMILDESLKVRLTYGQSTFNEENVRALTEAFFANLREIMRSCPDEGSAVKNPELRLNSQTPFVSDSVRLTDKELEDLYKQFDAV